MKKFLILLFVTMSVIVNAQVRILNIIANDLTYDKDNKNLYAIVSSTDYNYGNRLIKINPSTGAVERSVYIGSDPKRIKLTTSKKYAYVSFSSIGYIKRIDLNTFTVDKEIVLGPLGTSATAYAMDFEIIPNTDNKIVVSRAEVNYSDYFRDLVMYIDGIIQPKKITGSYDIIQLVSKSDGKMIFGYNSSDTGFDCYRVAILEDGVSLIDNYTGLIESFCKIKVQNDTVYCGNGIVLDAFSSIPSIKGANPVGSLPKVHGFTLSDFHKAYIYPYCDYNELYLNFFNKDTYSYSGSFKVYLPENLKTISYKILSLEAIDQQTVALIITDQFNYQLIVIVDLSFVLKPPVADFSANTYSGTVPLTVQFNDESMNSPTNWIWDFNLDGYPDSNLPNPSYTFYSPGVYTIKLKVTNDAGNDEKIKVNYITVTSATEITNNDFEKIKCSPNPVKEYLNISFPDNLDIMSVEIYSFTGNRVYQTKNISNGSLSINLSSVRSGVLFVKLIGKNNLIVKKIIKE